MGSLVFVLPRLKEICAASHTVLPGPMLFSLEISDLLKSNLILTLVVMASTLALLEWRSDWWKRRRRMFLGIAAFFLNSLVLLFISLMFVLAVLAGSNLLPHHQ
jgi:type II secretory pathway component PulF